MRRSGRTWRGLAVPVLALVGVLAGGLPATATTLAGPRAAPAGPAVPSFAPDHVPAHARPGTLLAAVPETALDPTLVALGAREWRIFYVSRSGLDDRPVIVSGAVIEPAGSVPAGGWPLLAWAHGTTGVADDCAPSLTSNLANQLPALIPLLQQGFVVTATDYEGLGTPGPHPYLIPRSEGRSVIDSVRAARALVPHTSDRWAVFGASQGGQAAWAAGELAAEYGEGLHYLGAAAAAPAADITGSVTGLPTSLGASQRALFPLVLYGLKLQHPRLNYADFLSGEALALTPLIPVTCATAAIFATLPVADFAPRSAQAVEQVRDWLARNALPQRRAAGPMFVGQGTADTLVLPAWVDGAVARACRLGDTIQYVKYPGAGHPALPAAELDIVRWLDARFAGVAPPSTCPAR